MRKMRGVFRLKAVATAVCVVVLVFAAGYGMGYLVGGLEVKPVFTNTGFADTGRPPADFKEDFSLFWEARDVMKRKFLRANKIEDRKMLYGAIKGAVGSLDDPYSVFLEPSDAERFDQDIQGSFGGIGAEIGTRNGQLVVVAPLKGNPAEQAGLKAGDRILEIDATSTEGLAAEQAVKMIRGEIGTEVTLLIGREGWDEPREFKVKRGVINMPTLEWEMVGATPEREKDVFLVKLFNFNALALQKFSEASFSALFQGTNGIVLDVRNNPGGFLDVARDIAGWFVGRGEVVTGERKGDGSVEEVRSRGNGALKHLPVVVLVNEGSASASEILAGMLRDLRHAKLVGDKTFGKGSVQELEKLADGSTLKITTAEWITPLGASIDEVGLTPDFEVKNEDEAEGDEQLTKALEVLAGQLPETRAIPHIILDF